MTKILFFILSISIFSPIACLAQQNDITFLVKTIKESYAGYDTKTKDNEFDKQVRKIIKENGSDTFRILSEIVHYFRDPHLSILGRRIDAKDTVTYKHNYNSVRAYLSSPSLKKDSREGYWINNYNSCVIALKRVKQRPDEYIGYIMETRRKIFLPGFISMHIAPVSKNKYRVWYTGPNGGDRVYLDATFTNDSILNTGFYAKWKKLEKYDKPILPTLPEYNPNATARLLDSNNFLITIPGNSEANTKIVDSIVKANYNILSKTKNLIVDIRDNSGGTVRTYSPLLPFVYTNPIARIGGYKKYTKALLQAEEQELKEYKRLYPTDKAVINLREEQLIETITNLGKTVYDTADVYTLDSIKPYPVNVAIIANNGCLSAAEMMIMDFKQSKKVTVFGEHTFGAIDYLDNFSLELPSKIYSLNIASVKRKIPAGNNPIDNIGISPDVPIPDSVTNWVQFVQHYYQKTGRDK